MTSQTETETPPPWLFACIPFGNVADHNADPEDTNPEDVSWVDVGGRDGSQLAAVKKAFPDSTGRMVLQNRSAVLEAVPKIEGVELMTHDILTEQPVHNASAYYFRQILSTSDDETCIQILQMHLPALQHSPRSFIYIDDKVLPDQEPEAGAPSVEDTAAQHTPANDAQERREKRWRWLVDQAGMEVLAINKYGDSGDSVIIAKRRYQDPWR